ncbi:MAG: RNA polymerase subunit sigma-70 [Anaerolineae bacterium]|nr:RNA polymerase subunit sigma-70 [Anaerolineae bacterium]
MQPPLDALPQEQFGGLVEAYRRELKVHCYRLMGSLQDAEDMVQETFLRAWRSRESLREPAHLRAWLYKIATHACLDALRKRTRRAVPITHQDASDLSQPIPPSVMEPIWLEPFPDEWLLFDEDQADSAFTTRENIALAFIAALHLLPPRQRAILILRDVLDWRADEVADFLGVTVSAVKSALHRARGALASAPPALSHPPDSQQFTRLQDYIRAWEAADVEGLTRLLKDDATFSMPPIPSWYQGRETIAALVERTIFSGEAAGRWRLLPTHANGQPAFALYRAAETAVHQAYGIQVLTLHEDRIADIITFRSPALVAAFKMPMTLPSV